MNMDVIFTALLWIHIAAGFTALVVAPGAMLTKKGSQRHRQWGKTYFWAMFVVALTSVAMSLMRSGVFLLLVGVFSFYLSFSGYRAIFHKRPSDKIALLDWSVSGLTLTGSIALLIYGVLQYQSGVGFGVVAMIFGTVGSAAAGQDLYRYVRPPKDKRAWWFRHMQGFLGAYIATVTAFSAVNFTFMPPVLRWLWPTVIGSIGIAIWTRYYRQKFAKPKRNAPVARPSITT